MYCTRSGYAHFFLIYRIPPQFSEGCNAAGVDASVAGAAGAHVAGVTAVDAGIAASLPAAADFAAAAWGRFL